MANQVMLQEDTCKNIHKYVSFKKKERFILKYKNRNECFQYFI